MARGLYLGHVSLAVEPNQPEDDGKYGIPDLALPNAALPLAYTLEMLGRLDGDRPVVTVRARRAVDRYLELSALWFRGGHAFSLTARDLGFASSSVAAVPFVTPRVAGQMDVMDHAHRSSGGRKGEPSSRIL
jgi:hypothetical protein